MGEEYEETMKGGRTLKVSILISLITLNSCLIQGFFFTVVCDNNGRRENSDQLCE